MPLCKAHAGGTLDPPIFGHGDGRGGSAENRELHLSLRAKSIGAQRVSSPPRRRFLVLPSVVLSQQLWLFAAGSHFPQSAPDRRCNSPSVVHCSPLTEGVSDSGLIKRDTAQMVHSACKHPQRTSGPLGCGSIPNCRASAPSEKWPWPLGRRKYSRFICRYKQDSLQANSTNVKTRSPRGITQSSRRLAVRRSTADCSVWNGVKL